MNKLTTKTLKKTLTDKQIICFFTFSLLFIVSSFIVFIINNDILLHTKDNSFFSLLNSNIHLFGAIAMFIFVFAFTSLLSIEQTNMKDIADIIISIISVIIISFISSLLFYFVLYITTFKWIDSLRIAYE